MAYYTTEELKHENERLTGENNALKLHIAQIKEDHEVEAQDWAQKEDEFTQQIQAHIVAIEDLKDQTRTQTRKAPSSSSPKKHKQQSRSREDYDDVVQEVTEILEDLTRSQVLDASKSRMDLNFEEVVRAVAELRMRKAKEQQRDAEQHDKRRSDSRSERRQSRRSFDQNTKARIAGNVNEQVRRLKDLPKRPSTRVSQREEEMFSFGVDDGQNEPSRSVRASTAEPRLENEATSASKRSSKGSKEPRRVVKKVVVQSYASSEDGDSVLEDVTGQQSQRDVDDADITELSDMDSREIARLRKTLELERLERKGRTAKLVAADQAKDQTSHSTNLANGPSITTTKQHTLPRKSSLKKLSDRQDLTAASIRNERNNTGRLSLPGDNAVGQEQEREQDERTSASVRHRRAQSAFELPLRTASSLSSSRRRNIANELTSAYILPDVTLNKAMPSTAKSGSTRPTLTEEEQHVVSNLAPTHDAKTCTICQRAAASADPKSDSDPKPIITIPAPIPVTSRTDPTSEEANDTLLSNPTLRPSEQPSTALAKVVKTIEDEITHLKLSLQKYEQLYHAHDPAVGKRKRAILCRRIDGLRREIEKRAEMVYRLYDVVEGQKQAGQLPRMKEQEVEMTLLDLGCSKEEVGLRLRGGAVVFDVDGLDKAEAAGDDDDDSNDEGDNGMHAEGGARSSRIHRVRGAGNGDEDEDEDEDEYERGEEQRSEDAAFETGELPWEGIEDTGDFTRELRRETVERGTGRDVNVS